MCCCLYAFHLAEAEQSCCTHVGHGDCISLSLCLPPVLALSPSLCLCLGKVGQLRFLKLLLL